MAAGPRVVRPALAQPAGHRRALRLLRHPQPPRALGALPPAHAPDARLGSGPAHPRACSSRRCSCGTWWAPGSRTSWPARGTPTRSWCSRITQLDPVAGLRQVVVLVVAWIHGCTGLHFWLRLRPWYPRVARAIYSGFLLLPVLALLGFAAAGQRGGAAGARARLRPGGDPRGPASGSGAARRAGARRADHLLGRPGRDRAGAGGARRRASTSAAGRACGSGIRAAARCSCPPASRCSRRAASPGIPHASVCGGRGRCSTCRVRVIRGGEHLPGRDRRRAARARARGRARPRAAGLPGPPAARSRGGAARARRRRAARRGGRGGHHERSPRRRGADDRGALRGPARVHPPGRAEAPVRRGLHPQPLLRGGRRRHHGCGRHRQPVHRRRGHGALRRGRRRARGGLPPGGPRGGGDGRPRAGAEPYPRRRSGHRAAPRDRHSHRPHRGRARWATRPRRT